MLDFFFFFFMDLILGHCWIWVKFVMDKALKEVCWLEELVRVVEQLYGADAVKVPHMQPSMAFVPSLSGFTSFHSWRSPRNHLDLRQVGLVVGR